MKKVSLIYTAVLLTGALSLVSCDRDDGDLTPKEGEEWQGEGYYSHGAIINPISDSSVKNAIEYKPFFKSGSSKDDSAERKQVSEFTVPSEVTMNGETYIVTKLADNAFQGCVNLTSVTLPNTITEIGLNAFYGCRKLSSITLPNSLELIGNTAFHGCMGLTSITIPENVKKLGYQMFYNCI